MADCVDSVGSVDAADTGLISCAEQVASITSVAHVVDRINPWVGFMVRPQNRVTWLSPEDLDEGSSPWSTWSRGFATDLSDEM